MKSKQKRVWIKKLLHAGILFLLLIGAGRAQQGDLTQLSIEDLANIQVTSASKRSESLSGAAAAIFVLTTEDLRRGGFTTLPDALRSVPGLYVVETTPHSWQISARGFSDTSNNKMLVLVDGRNVYTPLFGGVYWDALDLPLENIERIEVIRGPGGTLWGANAVNGVINIVTRSPKDSQGVTVSTSADINQGYTSTVQFAGEAGRNISYRVFGKAAYSELLAAQDGSELPSSFNLSQAGMRVDWVASRNDDLSIEGETYGGRFQEPVPFTLFSPELLKGSHLLLHWKHTLSSRSSLDSLAYCDWYTRDGIAQEKRNTCDFEFQHNYALSSRHSLIWGGAFSTTGDNLQPRVVTLLPVRRRTYLGSAFAQYEWVAVPDRLRILAGSKFEHNDYSGFEYQPQIRAVWTPAKAHTAWASVSRAVRDPNRGNSDIHYEFFSGELIGLPVFYRVLGNPNARAEKLQAYEIGYRYQPTPALSFDLALYYNDYDDLIVYLIRPPAFLPNQVVIQLETVNGPGAQTHGAEFSANWRPIRRWMLSPSLTELRGSANAAGANPRHMAKVQSRVDLPHRFEFDSGFYYYNALPVQPNPQSLLLQPRGTPTVNRVDVGLAWHATPQWTLAVWGRNLQSAYHVGSLDAALAGPAGAVPRAVVFRLMWQSKPEKTGPTK